MANVFTSLTWTRIKQPTKPEFTETTLRKEQRRTKQSKIHNTPRN